MRHIIAAKHEGADGEDDLSAEPEDPFLEAELDRALAPYKAILPPDMLAHYRRLLGDVLTTHPLGAKLLDRARPRAVPQQTEVQRKGSPPNAKGGRSA